MEATTSRSSKITPKNRQYYLHLVTWMWIIRNNERVFLIKHQQQQKNNTKINLVCNNMKFSFENRKVEKKTNEYSIRWKKMNNPFEWKQFTLIMLRDSTKTILFSIHNHKICKVLIFRAAHMHTRFYKHL